MGETLIEQGRQWLGTMFGHREFLDSPQSAAATIDTDPDRFKPCIVKREPFWSSRS